MLGARLRFALLLLLSRCDAPNHATSNASQSDPGGNVAILPIEYAGTEQRHRKTLSLLFVCPRVGVYWRSSVSEDERYGEGGMRSLDHGMTGMAVSTSDVRTSPGSAKLYPLPMRSSRQRQNI
jgi:hypothetical protein